MRTVKLTSLTLLVFCAIALVAGCSSDRNKLIARKWVVTRVSVSNETPDETSRNAKMIGTSFEIKSDGTYTTDFIDTTDKSSWVITGDTIYFDSPKTGRDAVHIKTLSDKSLIFAGQVGNRELTYEMKPWTENSPKKPVE